MLIKSSMIRLFTRRSGGVGWSLLSEAKSLKTTQVKSSGSSPLRFDGSRDGRARSWNGYLAATLGLYSLKLKPRGTIKFKSIQITLFLW
jgi:hypothetical protein